MGMADDHTLRTYRSDDSYRDAAEPASERAGGNDPLAELARLLGQSDPFAEFGRTNSRQKQQPAQPVARDAPTTAPDDWPYVPAPEQQFAAADDFPTPQGQGTSQGASHGPSYGPSHAYSDAPAAEGWRSASRLDHDLPPAADHQEQAVDAQVQYEDERLQDDRQAAQYYYQDDVPLEPHEDDMYDDAPRAHRRGGLATALALVGCAVLGTAGAYAYRSYYGNPNVAQPPPVITADNSSPTKIVPAPAGDAQSGKAVQDRLANADKEQLVSKQEEPVALKDSGTQSAAGVVLPPPAAPGQVGAPAKPSTGSAPGGSNEPKKIRTVTIRPDGADPSGRPVSVLPPGTQAPAGTRPATTPPAPRAGTAAPARNGGGPISLDPQPNEPAAPAGQARTAAAPPARTAPSAPESAAAGFLVQLSSQKSESEARSSFRSLQAKFPDELGGRQPVIRRADLGSKGVFYRTMVGPFASAHEASQFCASFKAAGGQCVVPNN